MDEARHPWRRLIHQTGSGQAWMTVATEFPAWKRTLPITSTGKPMRRRRWTIKRAGFSGQATLTLQRYGLDRRAQLYLRGRFPPTC